MHQIDDAQEYPYFDHHNGILALFYCSIGIYSRESRQINPIRLDQNRL